MIMDIQMSDTEAKEILVALRHLRDNSPAVWVKAMCPALMDLWDVLKYLAGDRRGD